MGRLKIAAWLTVQSFKEHAVLIPVAIAVLDAAAGFAAQPLADGSHDLNSLEAFAIGAAAGTLGLLLLIFLRYWVTTPRRVLEAQIGALAEKVDQLEKQLIAVAQQAMGDPNALQPVYQEVRAEIREAIRKIGNATETKQLWGFVDRLPVDNWKKHKDEIRANPWGDVDNYGKLAEAFRHIERLNQASSVRWFNRHVRSGDDLEVALLALYEADPRAVRCARRFFASGDGGRRGSAVSGGGRTRRGHPYLVQSEESHPSAVKSACI